MDLSFLSNPYVAAIAFGAVIILVLILTNKLSNVKVGNVEIATSRQKINGDISVSLELYKATKEKIWGLYLPLLQFSLLSIQKTCRGEFERDNKLMYVVSDAALRAEAWRHFKVRFFENHFTDLPEKEINRELLELSYSIRNEVIQSLYLYREYITQFDEENILPESEINTMCEIIKTAVHRLHRYKDVLAKESKTDLNDISTKIRRLS